MGRRDLATLAFRILGAYFFVTGLVQVPGMIVFPFWMWRMGVKAPGTLLIWVGVIGVAVELVIGILLWYLAGWLASLVFPHQEAPLPTNGATSRQWLVASLAVIGLFLAVVSISGVAGIVGAYYVWAWEKGSVFALREILVEGAPEPPLSLDLVSELRRMVCMTGGSPGASRPLAGDLVGELLRLAVGCVLLFRSSWIGVRLAHVPAPRASSTGGAE